MSEFTAGLLYRSAHADTLDPLLDDVDFVNDHDALNDAWHVATLDLEAVSLLFGPQQDDWPEEALQTKRVIVGALLSLSLSAPLLLFYNAEDHGWGYRLFHQGEECARFDLDYEADYRIAEAILQAAHPGQDEHQACNGEEWEAAHAAARQSDAWLAQLRAGLANAHPGRLAALAIAAETTAELVALLSEASLKAALSGEDFHQPVERFKALLGLDEMCWLS